MAEIIDNVLGSGLLLAVALALIVTVASQTNTASTSLCAVPPVLCAYPGANSLVLIVPLVTVALVLLAVYRRGGVDP
jgi:hypothetical protein